VSFEGQQRRWVDYYHEPVTITRGELQHLQMALGTADDYLLWLVELHGIRKGAVESVRKTVKEARDLASSLPTESEEAP